MEDGKPEMNAIVPIPPGVSLPAALAPDHFY
jgi:hypothetical protein